MRDTREFGRRGQVDPYGAHSMLCHQLPFGGIGAFTADFFSVFDYVSPNVYFVADCNLGYQMIGVAKEVAKVMMCVFSQVLHPFRFARLAEGDLNLTSHSPFAWS